MYYSCTQVCVCVSAWSSFLHFLIAVAVFFNFIFFFFWNSLLLLPLFPLYEKRRATHLTKEIDFRGWNIQPVSSICRSASIPVCNDIYLFIFFIIFLFKKKNKKKKAKRERSSRWKTAITFVKCCGKIKMHVTQKLPCMDHFFDNCFFSIVIDYFMVKTIVWKRWKNWKIKQKRSL